MRILEFFSLTTDQRFQIKWTRSDIDILRRLLIEAAYMREGTDFSSLGVSVDDVQELRTILENFAEERYGDSSPHFLAKIKEYFQAEIEMCECLIGSVA